MTIDVDALIAELSAQQDVDARIDDIKTLGAAEIDELLGYADSTDKAARKAAFFALQYCWSDAACALACDKL